MKVLILSCNTGEGHNSAAKAVCEYFINQNDECEIKDALSFWSPETSKIISRGHVFVYRRLPRLFGFCYRYEENHPPKEDDDSLIYDLVRHGCESLNEALCGSDYDAVICTHVFSAMMMTELRLRYRLRMPTYFVATDYTCSPGVNETALDAYFIPHAALADEFIENGVPPEQLVPTGIPVKQAFYQRLNRKSARRQLHLPTDKRIVLLTCGSMGCGPIRAITEDFPKALPENAHLVVICGSNRRLYRSLTKKDLPGNVTVVGYTTRMQLYMDAADLFLTKAGGLSTTEAAVKRLPMIFIDAVPGCETRNLEFFLAHRYALSGETEQELLQTILKCLAEPTLMTEMSERIGREFPPHAAQSIYKYITGKRNENH